MISSLGRQRILLGSAGLVPGENSLIRLLCKSNKGSCIFIILKRGRIHLKRHLPSLYESSTAFGPTSTFEISPQDIFSSLIIHGQPFTCYDISASYEREIIHIAYHVRLATVQDFSHDHRILDVQSVFHLESEQGLVCQKSSSEFKYNA